MNFKQPLWLAGFRPFFFLALLYGAIAPVLWFLIFSQYVAFPSGRISPVQWHAHEMLFGFGWAVLGGFLLTSSKNWVGVRGIHGLPLALAAFLWVVERATIFFSASLPNWTFWALSNLLIVYLATYICWTLWHFRKQDSFRDNFVFLIILPIFVIAKNMLLSGEWYLLGVMIALGLFRVAFVMMFERTLTQFMKNAMAVELVRNRYLDGSIKFLAVLSVFAPILSPTIGGAMLLLTAALLGFRFLLWRPLKALTNFGIALSYFGYAGLTLHFSIEGLKQLGLVTFVGSVSIHAFTFLCMGVVIPAMIIRISQGHTGRKLVFTGSDRLAIFSLVVGAFFRLVATQLWPQLYLWWVLAAAIGWSICFGLIGIRLAPFLLNARIDGREH